MLTDDATRQRMARHLTYKGIICWCGVFTPFSTMYRAWMFNGGKSTIEYTEYYVFGIRVARKRL